jgi:type I restriction-modification system DNA methylase subunit
MQKKCNFQRCIFSVAFFLQLATLHFLRCIFFATLINFCIFFTKKKRKNANKNATAPKQMQRRMRKNATSKVAFSELHFFCNLRRRIFLADFFLFETCDIAFSNLLVFGKLLQQATHLGAGKLRKISLPTLSLQN